jgi:hypothetical protein
MRECTSGQAITFNRLVNVQRSAAFRIEPFYEASEFFLPDHWNYATVATVAALSVNQKSPSAHNLSASHGFQPRAGAMLDCISVGGMLNPIPSGRYRATVYMLSCGHIVRLLTLEVRIVHDIGGKHVLTFSASTPGQGEIMNVPLPDRSAEDAFDDVVLQPDHIPVQGSPSAPLEFNLS